MHLTAGVYLSLAPDPPPPVAHCMNTDPCTYSHRERGGEGDSWTSEKVRGALVHKRGRKYKHDWLYLQSINSITPVKTTFRVWRLYSYLVDSVTPYHAVENSAAAGGELLGHEAETGTGDVTVGGELQGDHVTHGEEGGGGPARPTPAPQHGRVRVVWPREKTYTIEHRAAKAAQLASWRENDLARRVLLVMAALEYFPCVRIFPGMKPSSAWVHLHLNYSAFMVLNIVNCVNISNLSWWANNICIYYLKNECLL